MDRAGLDRGRLKQHHNVALQYITLLKICSSVHKKNIFLLLSPIVLQLITGKIIINDFSPAINSKGFVGSKTRKIRFEGVVRHPQKTTP